MSNRFARIIGTGSALPRTVVSNDQLAARLALRGVETSDQWIVERTGIKQRYLAEDDETTSGLAEVAARRALEMAQVQAQDLDLIIVATSTPDVIFPSTACFLQAKLGNRGAAAFDLQAVCSGFVYALSVADQFIRCGNARKALVVGAETFSRIMDWDDRGTCVLFGDGAGAVVLAADEQAGILSHGLHADGSHTDVLKTAGGVRGGAVFGHPFLTMDGQAVFKLAVSSLDAVAREVLDKAQLTASDLDWFIPHQANVRILSATARKLGLPESKVIVTVDQHGNTSAASVPLALDCAVRDGRVRTGQNLMLQGVGGGFTWGAVALRF